MRCVVAQVPLISGSDNARRLIRADHLADLRAGFDAGRLPRYRADPTPLTVVVAAEDHRPPVDLATAGFEGASHPKELVVLPGGHVDAHVGEAFTTSSAAQTRWFFEHLK